MRETCATSEFYEALRLLCDKYGAVVRLTIIVGTDERQGVLEQLRQRELDAQVEGADWQIFKPD